MWVKHGSRTTRSLVPYRPDLCIASGTEPLSTAEDLLAADPRVFRTWRDRCRTWLRGPRTEVLRVQPRRLQDLHRVATDLRRATDTKGFTFYDVDNRPESRWMHQRGLFTMCRLAVRNGDPVLEPHPEEDRWGLDYPDPDLVSARLAVHARHGPEPSWEDPLEAIAFAGETIPCDAPGDPESERAVLRELGERLDALDPDVITTRRGDRWDLPYLLRRIRRLGLHGQVRLGRDPDPHPDHPDQRAQSLHTYGRWLFKTHAYYLRGRWHIDLSKKTLDAEDDRKDLHGITYLTRVSNRRAQDVNRNGAGYALQQMQIDLAVDLGVALPWKRNLAEDWKDAATLCAVDRGGQIMVPEPGVHEDVAAADFSGYYPSLVVRHNLSSDTIDCACCRDDPRAMVVPELGMHVCRRTHGHQAEVLRRLWPHRRYVKAILRKAARGGGVDPDRVERCRAVKAEHKALGVVCFGYFRYRNARFGCAEVHQAIQALGRAGMTRARELAHQDGFEVVHTMTDCIFLHKPGVTRSEALAIARRITWEVGVPMDLEGIYRWIVFLPSKTHSIASGAGVRGPAQQVAGKTSPGLVGVPNRYYGKFETGELKVRGIEVQRHSTCGWVYGVQQGMLDVFQQADDAVDFLMRIPRALGVAKRGADRLRARAVDLPELGLTVQANRRLEDYTANTATRAALERLDEAGIQRHPGEYVQYILTRGSGPWASRVVPLELIGQGSHWFEDTGTPYHVPSYLRLLARSVETLLSPFGYEEEALYDWLRGASDDPRPPTTTIERLDVDKGPAWVRR